jgi:hypothetical protein
MNSITLSAHEDLRRKYQEEARKRGLLQKSLAELIDAINNRDDLDTAEWEKLLRAMEEE